MATTNLQVEVIPSADLTGLENALVKTEQLTSKLVPLRQAAIQLEVKFPSKEQYLRAGEVLSEVRSLGKEGEAIFSPFNVIVDRVRTFLRTKLQRHTNACAEIEAVILPKMKAWEQDELKATQEEQATVDKQAAKTGGPRMTVQPEVPSVPGYRRSTNYRAEVVDVEKLFKAWKNAKGEYQKYLQRFIIVDVKELNLEARELKNPAALMKKIPGVRAWQE